MLAVCRACQFFLPDLIGRHVLIRSDSMSVVSYINHQGGVSSKRLFILAERLLEWAQLNLRSLRAAHLPGRLNQGANMLSLSNVPSEEWMLHPQVFQKIWKTFGKAEVDLFASKDISHCPTYYLKDRDALAHDWPNLLLYAFPQIALLPQVAISSVHFELKQGNEYRALQLIRILRPSPTRVPVFLSLYLSSP